MDLVLFGIQGSGKGTQAKMLSEQCGFTVFEAGGELRRIKKSGSELGKKIASYIDVGKLVPHTVIMQVCREWVDAQGADMKILFDGMPRDLDQMRDFDAIMEETGREFQCVQILLDPEVGVERILGRAKEQGRADDADEEIIRRRMQTFQEKTMPVIEKYKEAGKLFEVDGRGSIEEVYKRMTHTLQLS